MPTIRQKRTVIFYAKVHYRTKVREKLVRFTCIAIVNLHPTSYQGDISRLFFDGVDAGYAKNDFERRTVRGELI